jgi:ribosomal protein S18 acetylase RimI-like enzyme
MNRRLSATWCIRFGAPQDLDGVLELWERAGVRRIGLDSTDTLRMLLASDPRALLVAGADGEEPVGSLIAAWNGWRGSLYRLAVDPGHRRRGLATQLVRAGEGRLRSSGATRVDAIVDEVDPVASAFWRSVGYQLEPHRSRFVRNY